MNFLKIENPNYSCIFFQLCNKYEISMLINTPNLGNGSAQAESSLNKKRRYVYLLEMLQGRLTEETQSCTTQ
jgi:hypothetical protein